MEALSVALARATALHAVMCALEMLRMAMCRALMPGGYGFDASGSILVQCVPQDGSKSSWVL
jgi:hypothetical protein